MGAIGIVGIAVGLIILGRGVLFIRSKNRTIESMFVWLLVGMGIIILAADPKIIGQYINIFGFQENSVLILIFGVLFLVLIVFWLYNMIFELKEKVKILHDNLALIESNFLEAKKTKDSDADIPK